MLTEFFGRATTENHSGRDKQVPAVKDCRFTQTAFGTVVHTFASRICENETNVKIIQQLMGHADVSTTMNIYAEVNAESTRESIENLAKNLDVF